MVAEVCLLLQTLQDFNTPPALRVWQGAALLLSVLFIQGDAGEQSAHSHVHTEPR